MSKKALSILAAILIIAAFFSGRAGIANGCVSASSTSQYNDTLTRNQIKAMYDQRIIRTVRCLIGAGTSPSLVYRQVNKLYDEREQVINKCKQ